MCKWDQMIVSLFMVKIQNKHLCKNDLEAKGVIKRK